MAGLGAGAGAGSARLRCRPRLLPAALGAPPPPPPAGRRRHRLPARVKEEPGSGRGRAAGERCAGRAARLPRCRDTPPRSSARGPRPASVHRRPPPAASLPAACHPPQTTTLCPLPGDSPARALTVNSSITHPGTLKMFIVRFAVQTGICGVLRNFFDGPVFLRDVYKGLWGWADVNVTLLQS